MKTRLLSGVIFFFVMVGFIFAHWASFLLLFSIISIVCLIEFYQLTVDDFSVNSAFTFYGTFIAFWPFLIEIIRFIYPEQIPDYFELTLLPIVILPLLIVFLFKSSNKSLAKYAYVILAFFYIGWFMSRIISLASFQMDTYTYNPSMILGILLLIWTSDSFAYITGRKFGKTKLFPKVSPGKTWEGWIGGAVITILISFFYHYLFSGLLRSDWLVIAIIVVIFGPLGDLFESKLKRIKGVKDSGKIMPGHGGILDRFDALLFIVPVIYFYLQIRYASG